MLTSYIRTAMSRATCKELDGGDRLFFEIPGLSGVWAVAGTREAGLRELQEVLEDWIELGLSMHHELPEVAGIDINVE